MNELYLLKFNNENILKDECGNIWSIDLDNVTYNDLPYLSNDGIIYPAINFSGSNYIETSAEKFIINSNWSIDFWLYLEKSDPYLTYLSIRGDNLIIGSNNVSIKTNDYKFQKIKINIPLHKWIHFALTKYGNYISIHINGNMYTFIRLSKFLINYSYNKFQNIITLGKSITAVNCDCPYKLMHFRISNIARFKINQSFDPLSTIAYINKTQLKSIINVKQRIYKLNRQVLFNTLINENTHNNTLITINNINNTQRNIKRRYYKLSYTTKRIIEKFLSEESYDFLPNSRIINDNCLYLLKFNNEDILKDECGNTWSFGANSSTPYLSNDGIIYPAINFSGSNYIETSAEKFIINSNWTIDFWLYLEKSDPNLTFASIQGYNLIIENKIIYIKLYNNEYYTISDINIPLYKWIHFALTKYGNYISIHINGNMYTFIRLPSFICTESNINLITLGKSITAVNCDCPYKLMHFRISNIARFKINQSFDPLSTIAYINKTQLKSIINVKQRIYKLNRQVLFNTLINENTHNNTLITINNINNTQRNIKRRYYKLSYTTKRIIAKQFINLESYLIFSNGPTTINYSKRVIAKTITQIFNTITSNKLSNYQEYHSYYFNEKLTPEKIQIKEFLLHIKVKYNITRKIEKDKEEKIERKVVLITRDYDKNYEYTNRNESPLIHINEKINMQRIIFKNIKLINFVKKLNIDYINDNNYYYDPLTELPPFIDYFKCKFDLIRKINKDIRLEIKLKNDRIIYNNNFEYSPLPSLYINKIIKLNCIRIVEQDKQNIIPSHTATIIRATEYDNSFEYSPLPSLYINKIIKLNCIRIVEQDKQNIIPQNIIIRTTEYDNNYEYDDNDVIPYFITIKNNLKRNININIQLVNRLKKYYNIYNEKFEYSPLPIQSIFTKYICFKNNTKRYISNNESYNKYTKYKIRISNYDIRYSYQPLSSSLIYYRKKNNTSRVIKQNIIISQPIQQVKEIQYDNRYEYSPLPNYINIRRKSNTSRTIKQDIVVQPNKSINSIKEIQYDNRYEYSPLPNYINIRRKSNTSRTIKKTIIEQPKEVPIKKINYNKNIILKTYCKRIITNDKSKHSLPPEIIKYYTYYKNNFNVHY